MGTGGIGPISSRYCILGGSPSVSAFNSGTPFSDWEQRTLENLLLKAGIHPSECRFELLTYKKARPTSENIESAFKRLNSMKHLDTIISLGETPLKTLTGKSSIDKWHLSPLDTVGPLKCRKVMPTYGMDRLRKNYQVHLYMVRAFMRAKQYIGKPWYRKPKRFLLNPNYENTLEVLDEIQAKHFRLGLDIETGHGVINTLGLAWSPNDAIAMQTLPERLSADKYYTLWTRIARILEDPNRELIIQNLTYEDMYLSRYGSKLANIFHDTMWAQRLLYPELAVGLDNVGRLYTEEPYWKDTGKEHKSEGVKKDWGNIKDWTKHFEYNCLDSANMFEAAQRQIKDLVQRGQYGLYRDYLIRLRYGVSEICARGLPINEHKRGELARTTEAEMQALKAKLSKDINPKSAKQKAKLLKDKGYKLPRVKDPKTGGSRESTNELSLKKLRLKHPNDMDIDTLLKFAKASKALGSYINIDYDSDQRVRFMLNGAGTETLRFSSSKDPWDQGFNAQTIPSKYKIMFDAPPGKIWLQVDLAQAESRFVAYDSCDTKLISMLENKEDIHSYVAAHIFNVSVEQVLSEVRSGDKSKRQLGKKSGHGANYDMGVTTFMESCLKEMDLVLDRKMAKKVLDTYHSLFPGIRRWHAQIRETLYRERKLANPLGHVRYAYNRLDDNTFREFYAFRPQSTIPMITNYLMLYLLDARLESRVDFTLHNQVHDSLVMLIDDKPDKYLPIVDIARDTELWHPDIQLPAGKLVIPVDIEMGHNLGKLGGVPNEH